MKKGFTLIGLIAIILVLGIIASIALLVVNNTKGGITTPSENVTEAKWMDKGKYKLLKAEGNNSLGAEVGDEIEVNGENFYVISNDGTNIAALAKYNLNVGRNKVSGTEGIQNALATGYVSVGSSPYPGSVAFSDNNGWAYANNEDIDIQSYDGPVKTTLNNYKAIVTDASKVRLITKTELEGLGCAFSSYTCSGAPAWVYSTSYWVGSAYSYNVDYVLLVRSSGSFGYGYFNYETGFGVRPVIEIEA